MSSPEVEPRNADSGPLWLRAGIGLAIGAAIFAVHHSPLRAWIAPSGFAAAREWLAGLGALAPAGFVGLCGLGIGLGLPRLGFAAAGGLAFGGLHGSLLAQIGTIAGCAINFGWARYLAREFAQRHGGRRLGALTERVARRPIATNVFLRLIPVGNSLALNSFLAICPISGRDFLIGTAIGTLPETVAFALFGAGAASGSAIALVAGAALVLLLLAGTLGALFRERRSLGRETA